MLTTAWGKAEKKRTWRAKDQRGGGWESSGWFSVHYVWICLKIPVLKSVTGSFYFLQYL